MEGSQDGERRARRTGVLIGFLAALVIALGVALAIVLSGGDSGKDKTSATTPTATTAPTTPSTETTVTTTEPPTTTTAPDGGTIDQVQAKEAARRGASVEVTHFGISIPPQDWDARCTAAGGFDRAPVWTCQVAANGGQCSGTLFAIARPGGVPGTREPHIACGE